MRFPASLGQLTVLQVDCIAVRSSYLSESSQRRNDQSEPPNDTPRLFVAHWFDERECVNQRTSSVKYDHLQKVLNRWYGGVVLIVVPGVVLRDQLIQSRS